MSIAASNGENLPREYSSKQYGYRFNLSVHADVHWIEGDSLSVSTAASNGENLFRKYPSKQYGLSIQSIGTC